MADDSPAHAATRLHSPLVIDVALTPSQLDSPELRTRTTCIVVDVIRATTTLSVLFERGCRSVLVAPNVAAARAARADLAARGAEALLAGEVEGLPPPGFDYGNSPAEFSQHDLAGRDVIFATTNGTRAIRACAGSRAILIGALRNAGAVTHAALDLMLAHSDPPAPPAGMTGASSNASRATASEAHVEEDDVPGADIVVVCSGRGGRPAFDDTLCAGYLVRSLVERAAGAGIRTLVREPGRIALSVLAQAEESASLRDALASSNAARAVERIGLGADLELCAAVDAAAVVPLVSGELAGVGMFDLLRITRYVT